MRKMTRQEKHAQCVKEITGTLILVFVCCVWHVGSAFMLNGSGWKFLGMPAWFSVSVLGTILIAHAGLIFLLKNVFVDFEYDEETDENGENRQ